MWLATNPEEPEWVKSEREQFSKNRDFNQDGFMDRDEVEQWISPPRYDYVAAEAKHLMFESDADTVQVVTCCMSLSQQLSHPVYYPGPCE